MRVKCKYSSKEFKLCRLLNYYVMLAILCYKLRANDETLSLLLRIGKSMILEKVKTRTLQQCEVIEVLKSGRYMRIDVIVDVSYARTRLVKMTKVNTYRSHTKAQCR